MDRRTFLKGLVATAAGILVPASVAAEPERRVWALDRTMLEPRFQPPLGSQYWDIEADAMMTYMETGWIDTVTVSRRWVPGGSFWQPGDWMNVGGEYMQVIAEEPTQGWHQRYIVARYPDGLPPTPRA